MPSFAKSDPCIALNLTLAPTPIEPAWRWFNVSFRHVRFTGHDPIVGTIGSMNQSPDFQGRKALVTGSAKRLGRAFTEALAARGAQVIVHYRSSSEEAESLVEQLASQGARAVPLKADLGRPEQALTLVEQAVEALGGLDILVNSASIFEPLTLMETDLAAWERNLTVNLTAPFLLSQAFARQLDGGEGAIVNMLDWRALRPGDDHLPYTIAKAGLAALTRSLAQALAPNIRVNGLALGAILPPSGAGAQKDDTIIQDVPAGRWGSVEETVEALLFLLGGPAYVTGEILHLDGGRHLV